MSDRRTTIRNSSNIASIGYNSITKTLEVEFKTGETYAYSNVPPTKHAALMLSLSPGKFLHTEIRGKYRHVKVDRADAFKRAPLTSK